MTDAGFLKADSNNIPFVDAIMVANFFAKNELFSSTQAPGSKSHR